DINSRSIGIEIVNPGHAFGYKAFPKRQVAAVIELCRDLIARYRIRPERVLAHSDVAPGRKVDPGEKFPWGVLAKAEVGLHVRPVPLRAGAPTLGPGSSGADVAEVQALLSRYGYGIEV